MRLLNTTTLQFQEFFENERPAYAILSHRWTSDETTYKDFAKGRRQDSTGHAKVVAFCEFAKRLGHEWAWVDTCCIDKRSSAELSEAINSMYKWYFDAHTCYCHLADVRHTGTGRYSMPQTITSMQQSDWFRRGWTVQELIAPAQVVFCDADWRIFGDKHSLASTVAQITGIKENYLVGRGVSATACVATKMSWFADRQTTRREDTAYCMLGIFDINMPLLYGEGNKAFLRLQMEIIRRSRDQSIFAWEVFVYGDLESYSSILASTPRCFYNAGTLSPRFPNLTLYSMTQNGLELRVTPNMWLRVPAETTKTDHWGRRLLVCEIRLDCERIRDGRTHVACLEMRCRQGPSERWVRQNLTWKLLQNVREQQELVEPAQERTLLITQHLP